MRNVAGISLAILDDRTSGFHQHQQNHQNKAEYSCSTVDLARKYYQQDPEGIIELCVRTKLIGMYTYENGLGGSLTSQELEQYHARGTFTDVTMDSQGNVTIGDATLENWQGLCKSVIERMVDESN